MNFIKKVLIIEDEKKIVEVVKSYLEKDGFGVVVAYDGKQAIEYFEKIQPSLIILDLMLPDMNR